MNNPTDTNQASELFELCKEAYEKTGWETGELLSHRGLVRVPLYASDYLLEKLPMEKGNHVIVEKWSDGNWVALWQKSKGKRYTHAVADTPLKSLLILTIALSEAGELK